MENQNIRSVTTQFINKVIFCHHVTNTRIRSASNVKELTFVDTITGNKFVCTISQFNGTTCNLSIIQHSPKTGRNTSNSLFYKAIPQTPEALYDAFRSSNVATIFDSPASPAANA